MKNVVVDNKPASRFERKFSILPSNIGLALSFLRQVCLSDKEYPKDRVNSLYYDSIDLDEYERSASGEFNKNKVRIRWYGNVAESDGTTQVYLELKSRQGFASSKQREVFTVPSENLLPDRLGRGIVDKTTLNNTLAKFGHFPKSLLRPVIYISYQRYRFQEIQTGIRVSFDCDISATMIAPELRKYDNKVSLPNTVIEVKGPTIELPVTLRRMKFLDTDWSRFSKYGYCIDVLLSDPGSVARFSPSGRNIDL